MVVNEKGVRNVLAYDCLLRFVIRYFAQTIDDVDALALAALGWLDDP